MGLKLVSASIVVLANDHNPSILHPAFLETQGIVPAGKELAVEPLCSGQFAAIQYKDGIAFVAEPEKVQIADNQLPDDPSTSTLPKIATSYVQALPHVRYRALGVNLIGFIRVDAAASWIRTRFLKDGPWSDDSVGLASSAITLRFETAPTTLTVAIDSGTKTDPNGAELSGVLLKANYHVNLDAANALSEAVDAISLYEHRCDHFRELAARMTETKEGADA